MSGSPAWLQLAKEVLSLLKSTSFLVAVGLVLAFIFLEFDLTNLLEIIRASRGC